MCLTNIEGKLTPDEMEQVMAGSAYDGLTLGGLYSSGYYGDGGCTPIFYILGRL